MRVGKLGRHNEVVVNMFAGVGLFSIILAKHSPVQVVHSIDINPQAIRLMRENIILNKLCGRVTSVEEDAKEILEERFIGSVDRILMPLPAKSYEYLTIAVAALKNENGVLHYYDFIHASKGESPIEKLVEKIRHKLTQLGVEFRISTSRIVRTVGPRRYQVVLDIVIL